MIMNIWPKKHHYYKSILFFCGAYVVVEEGRPEGEREARGVRGEEGESNKLRSLAAKQSNKEHIHTKLYRTRTNGYTNE